ncbi:MAG: YqaE/Pmp3 family membrane protein [Planctomycetia bacterium]|nr:YqaE/Pmp3 family membrane protein [Planctomycetia bacterium]
MGIGRALLCILLPPLAVLDKGCGTVIIVTLLTIAGWVPGAIAAVVVCNQPPRPEA